MDRRDPLATLALPCMLLSLGFVHNLVASPPASVASKYLKYSLDPSYPQFTYFSVDSLGSSKLDNSPLLLAQDTKNARFTSKSNGTSTKYFSTKTQEIAAWEFEPTQKGFVLRSNHVDHNVPWVMKIDQARNHATVLGLVPAKTKISTPAVLHFPDMGSLRIRSEQVDVLDYTSSRVDVPAKFVQLSLPAATQEEPFLEYSFDIVAIYPGIEGVEDDPRFDGYRRNYLNTFQVNPNSMVLSNNSTSDSCAFVQYGYSELALHAPNLVDGLRAIDLVRMTVDRYLSGTKGYGMYGYVSDRLVATDTTLWGGQSASLDTYPSLLIAASNYYEGSGDDAWLKARYDGLVRWAEQILSRDKDGDGIVEYGFTGNTGSWTGTSEMRPANWWDTIGFGHKDAYSNALAYRALRKFARLSEAMGDGYRVERYSEFAERLRSNYYGTFINAHTGVLAGWKSADGELHDYYFMFVNSIAIAYGLVTKEQGNEIMDALLAKMDDVGFDSFELGLPGNLIPVKRGDYTHHDPRWGGSTSDELNDGWQHYENGGTSGNYVYFTLSALGRLGRSEDAKRILFPLLRALEAGAFQGDCDNGMTKDWRAWDGECWGYEGFLVDNYWGLLAVVEEHK